MIEGCKKILESITRNPSTLNGTILFLSSLGYVISQLHVDKTKYTTEWSPVLLLKVKITSQTVAKVLLKNTIIHKENTALLPKKKKKKKKKMRSFFHIIVNSTRIDTHLMI